LEKTILKHCTFDQKILLGAAKKGLFSNTEKGGSQAKAEAEGSFFTV